MQKHTSGFVAKGLCEIMRAETVERNLSVQDPALMCVCVCARAICIELACDKAAEVKIAACTMGSSAKTLLAESLT